MTDPTTPASIFPTPPQPWGPWTTPQLIFSPTRDQGFGVYIHNSDYSPPGPAGPTIDPSKHDPTNTTGTVYATSMIESFTRITNSTVFIYYTMATWNPYTVVKMRSAFTIIPLIDPASLVKLKKKFSFVWTAPTNISYQVDYSTNLLSACTSFTNFITSTNGDFHFTDDGTDSSGFGNTKYYRLRTSQ